MSTQLLLLLGGVLLAVIAALVWWRRGKLQELPVLSPQAAGSAPYGTEVVITGLAGGDSSSSPFTGASGLLFEADEVTEWTEPSSDGMRASQEQRSTRNLGPSGSLVFIEEAGSTINVRSGPNFDISDFPETRTASERSTDVSFGGDSAFSISSGNRRTWVKERVVRTNDRVWCVACFAVGRSMDLKRNFGCRARLSMPNCVNDLLRWGCSRCCRLGPSLARSSFDSLRRSEAAL